MIKWVPWKYVWSYTPSIMFVVAHSVLALLRIVLDLPLRIGCYACRCCIFSFHFEAIHHLSIYLFNSLHSSLGFKVITINIQSNSLSQRSIVWTGYYVSFFSFFFLSSHNITYVSENVHDRVQMVEVYWLVPLYTYIFTDIVFPIRNTIR